MHACMDVRIIHTHGPQLLDADMYAFAHSEVLTYAQAKYEEMTQKERDIAQKSDAEQIQEIMADEVLSA